MSSAFVRVVTDTEAVPSPPPQPAFVTGYEPDRFQKFAIEAIEAGENVLVTAKTGSGKTFVGEYQIAKSLARGGRIFYTTPIKSLTNQKFHDLKKLFPEASVGIMTGDIKFRPDAQIIVMTTEILRNLLFKRGTATEKIGVGALMTLDGLDSVVFDEVHYINDPDRGHVWEETLMLLPPTIKLILLSATLSSPYGFAEWLGELKKVRVWLISTLWRAVPLEHCVLAGGKPLVIYDAKEHFHDTVYREWFAGKGAALLAHDKFKQKVQQMKKGGFEGPVGGKMRPKSFEHQLNECLEYLDTHRCLPAIFFVFSRVGCEKLADKITGNFLDSSDAAAVANIWDFHLSRYKDSLEKSPQYHTLRTLAMRGIAFHHSGLLPFLKEILEVLFSKGYIKVLMATETFAVGINMPTKTVVFTALEKFTDGSVRPLRSAEYTQMAGRAGRRGKDDRGLVIYLPQRDPADLFEVRQILTGRAAAFGSRMNFHYDFVLRTKDTRALIEMSYWWTLLLKEVQRSKSELSDAIATLQQKRSLLTAEDMEGCEKKEELELRVATLHNAKKKVAQRELLSWQAEHKESKWNPIFERYKAICEASRTVTSLQGAVEQLEQEQEVPQVRLRQRVLSEYEYVDSAFQVTPKGNLASEVNEGHPFLTTELFLRMEGKAAAWSLTELLTILAIFLGDSPNEEAVPISELSVKGSVRAELARIADDAHLGYERERAHGLPDDLAFWTLTTEWVEPVAAWVGGETLLPVVAAEFGIFEGNLQRALMKLMGLVEEFRAMATLRADIGWLGLLEGAQMVVLRDVVVAESLYLRI
jgi:superfamily II RNA helicase